MIGYALILAAVIGSCIAAIRSGTLIGNVGFGWLAITFLCLLVLWRARK